MKLIPILIPNKPAARAVVERTLDAIKPPPDLTVSQWADQYRVLSSEASAEYGAWSTSRAEYQRGIMDAISDERIEEVVIMSCAQVGKTEMLLPLSRERGSLILPASDGQSRTIGASRSLENVCAISSVGCTTSIGDGSCAT